jgi:hypothetical protein
MRVKYIYQYETLTPLEAAMACEGANCQNCRHLSIRSGNSYLSLGPYCALTYDRLNQYPDCICCRWDLYGDPKERTVLMPVDPA